MMIGNILDNTTELSMIKYAFGEIFSSGGATLCKNPSDCTFFLGFLAHFEYVVLLLVTKKVSYQKVFKSTMKCEALWQGPITAQNMAHTTYSVY